MFDAALTTLAVSLPELTTLYWVCLIVGGGLIVISSVAGGDADAGFDADLDVDLDVDTGHAYASALTSWFSIQFVVFFLAMFGVVGVTLTHLTQRTSGVVLTLAISAGLLVGQGVHQLLRKLRRSSGDSTPKVDDYINKLARVTITVANEKKGEIALRVGRSDRFIAALARHSDDTFSPDQQVGVVAYRDGVAEVVSREEFEFLKG
ncbi:MAG: DUF1449 family protein [Planctomycetes bacterium]|nr:DUF1449 family protein [Planctomycetota bacterium]